MLRELRELATSLKSTLYRVPRRYWVCLLVSFTMFVMNTVKNVELIVFERLVISDEPEFTVPYRPGSFTCPYRHRKQQDPNFYKYSQIRWNDEVKQEVFGLLLFLHVLVLLPFGILSDVHGGHRVLLWTLAASSAVTLFTPASVDADPRGNFYFAMLLLRRITAGPLLPACMSLLGNWALPGERMTFVGILCSGWYSGHTLGWVLALAVLRWRALYYVNAALTALLALLWWAVARAWRARPPTTPPSPPSDVDVAVPRPRDIRRVPLVEMIYSPRLVCLYLFALATHGVSNILDQIILYYMRLALMSDFNDITNTRMDLFAPLQLLALSCPCLAAAVVSDRLVAAGLVGRPAARRALAVVGMAGVTVAVAGVVAAECNEGIVIGGFTAVDYFNSHLRVALWSASLDVAPLLAGTLFSVINALGTIGVKIMIDFVYNYLSLDEAGELRMWSGLFAVCAALIVILATPYLIWGPFHEMPWAKLDSTPYSKRAPRKYTICTVVTLLWITFVIFLIVFAL